MVITKHFVVLHVPKTGGTFVRTVCEQHLPRDWFVDPQELDWGSLGYHWHRSYDSLPEEFRSLPALCFVRNPWDWYVSSYHHTLAEPDNHHGWMWRTVFDAGRAAFPEMVTAFCHADSLQPPTSQRPRWVKTARELDCDWYSALFWDTAGVGLDTGRLEVGRFETLRQDLAGFMKRHEVPVPDDFLAAVEAERPINTSQRDRYQDYYEGPLQQLVGEKARRIVAEYGYRY